MKYYFLTFIAFILIACNSKQIPEIKLNFNNNIGVTYEETISYYKQMSEHYEYAKLIEIGQTDIGKPLHLFILSKDKLFNPNQIRNSEKAIVFINNGIHPGEPCGLEACLKISDDILQNKNGMQKILDNTIICIVPVYNVGGMLRRSKFNRANQKTPVETGFRGNGKNLDLNRDFIKVDSKNAKSFVNIFTTIRPDVFLDTHTTNGSDHQYTITLIEQPPATMHPLIANYFISKMKPALYSEMKKTKYELIPYIMPINRTPDKGITQYIPSPRFSTGYTNCFNNFCFMTENHIFKDFKDRVKSVYNFIKILLQFSNTNASEITQIINKSNNATKTQTQFEVDWQPDTTNFSIYRNFKGYEGKFKTSILTGQQRFYYDHSSPFTKDLKYYNYFNPKTIVRLPKKYIIPQAWSEVIERLKLNHVAMTQLPNDKKIKVEVFYISNFNSASRPYNGHYNHRNTQVKKDTQIIQYYKGDYLIETNQDCNKFLAAVLEPTAPDSYFNWNFFDSILDQREYFSSYIFEDRIIELFDKIPGLKKKYLKRKNSDPAFAKNHYAQLRFIYQNSPYFEKSFRRYPIGRIYN